MAKPTVPVLWKIIASSHPRFPGDASIELEPTEADPSRFRFHLSRQGQPKETLFEERFPDAPSPGAAVTFRGEFERDRKRLLVATVCPGKSDGTPKCLCGQFYDLESGIGDGATGVWVAEEQGPPKGPDGEC